MNILKNLSKIADRRDLTNEEMFHKPVYRFKSTAPTAEVNQCLKNYNVAAELDLVTDMWIVSEKYIRPVLTILHGFDIGISDLTDPEGKLIDYKPLIYKNLNAPQVKELRI